MPSACTQTHSALPTPEWKDIQQSKGYPSLWEGWISLEKATELHQDSHTSAWPYQVPGASKIIPSHFYKA